MQTRRIRLNARILLDIRDVESFEGQEIYVWVTYTRIIRVHTRIVP